jgi:NAD(P)-dependent dehydrogenase (short-subunit alcohol dehydrogenase family)
MNREEALGLFDLSGRVAIVTGGSRGIGAAIAEAFAALGARVVISSRKADQCEEQAEIISQAGGKAVAIPAHVGDLKDISSLVNRTIDVFGAIDIVVNNAANSLTLPVGSITPEAWQKTYETNVRGPLFLVQAAQPHLAASGHGVVINTVTAAVFQSGYGIALYHSSKSALLALTRSMAAELAPFAIRVNALAPGTVDTQMMRNNSPEDQARMESQSLMKRLATPGEMVGSAVFLASDASRYVTGEVLVADGGIAFH